MEPRTVMSGEHRVLLNEWGNVMQVGRTEAEATIRELRRNGHHAYTLRFSASIYFLAVANSRAEATRLQTHWDVQRQAVRRILAEQAPEMVASR